MSRARAFTFTINNHTYQDLDQVMDLSCEYLCFGFEVGEQGTPHIQGYVYFNDAKTMKSLSKKLPRAHIEISRGTAAENAIYTSKEGDDNWYFFGEQPHQGKIKWDLLESVMKDPKMNIHVYNQYNKSFRQIRYQQLRDKKMDRKVILISKDQRYDCGEDVFMDSDMDCYDGESKVILSAYHNTRHVMDWYHGYPPTIRRGYELIPFNPEIIYMMYDDMKEYNHILNLYADIIDGLKEKEL